MGDGDRAVWLLARPGDLPAHLLERGTPLVLVQVDKAELPSLTAGTGPPADPAGRLRRLLASGAGRRELSRDLQVSLRTVDRMIADVRRETGAATTAEAAARLRAMGW